MHGGDETSGDGIYTVQIGPFAAETVVEYQVLAKDIDGNEVLWPSFPFSFEVLPPFNPENDILLVVDSTWSGDVNFIAPFYRDALNDLGLTFDFWDTSLRVIVDVDTLN